MNQRERLRYLIDSFLKESDEYRNVAVPDDEEGQKRLLRSLMNGRMPVLITVFIPLQVYSCEMNATGRWRICVSSMAENTSSQQLCR